VTTLLVVPRIYLWLDSTHVWWRSVLSIARKHAQAAPEATQV